MLLESFYDKIGYEINKSEIVGFDETGYPIAVDGKVKLNSLFFVYF